MLTYADVLTKDSVGMSSISALAPSLSSPLSLDLGTLVLTFFAFLSLSLSERERKKE
jgi:uncharacterized membrane protein YczE